MTSPARSKRVGAQAELDLLAWIQEHLPAATANRVRLNGTEDLGDIQIVRWDKWITVVEVKACYTGKYEFSAWLRELEVEVGNVAARNPGKTVDGWLVVRPRGVVEPGRWWTLNYAAEVFG